MENNNVARRKVILKHCRFNLEEMRLHNKLRPQRNMRTHIIDFCARLPPTSTLLAQRPEGEVFDKALLMLFMTSFVFSTISHCGQLDLMWEQKFAGDSGPTL